MSDDDLTRRWVWRAAQFLGIWAGFGMALAFDWGVPDAINMVIGVGIWAIIFAGTGIMMDLDIRRQQAQRVRTEISVPGAILTYAGRLDEATVARIRRRFEAEMRSGRPPQVLP